MRRISELHEVAHVAFDPNEISRVIAILHLVDIEAGGGIFVPNGVLKRLEFLLALRFALISVAARTYEFDRGPVGIDLNKRIVPCIGVTVPRLGIPEFPVVRDGIRRHKPPHRRPEVPKSKIVISTFAIPFFGGEEAGVVAGAGGMNEAFATEGIIVDHVSAAIEAVEEADVAEGVEAVVVDPVVGLFAIDEPAGEIVVPIQFVARGVAFVNDIAVQAVPIEFVGGEGRAGSLFDALAVAIVEIGLASGSGEMIFGVEGEGGHRLDVSRREELAGSKKKRSREGEECAARGKEVVVVTTRF